MNGGAEARIFGMIDREIWLLTAADGARRDGLIATFVSQASIAPEMPRVLVGLARQHFTWELVERSGRFVLHLLGHEHLAWVWQFGLRSGRDGDKFAGLDVSQTASGCPLLPDALGWSQCRVEATLDTGDRTLYLAEVTDGQLREARAPLTLKGVLELAPPDKRQELKDQMARDAAIDAELIRQWRKAGLA